MPEKDIIEQLITEYGNTCFDCGEWDGDVGDDYKSVYGASELAKQALVAEIQRLQQQNADLTAKVASMERKLADEPHCGEGTTPKEKV